MIDKSEEIIALNINSLSAGTYLPFSISNPRHVSAITQFRTHVRCENDLDASARVCEYVCSPRICRDEVFVCFRRWKIAITLQNVVEDWTWHLIAKYVQKLELGEQTTQQVKQRELQNELMLLIELRERFLTRHIDSLELRLCFGGLSSSMGRQEREFSIHKKSFFFQLSCMIKKIIQIESLSSLIPFFLCLVKTA